MCGIAGILSQNSLISRMEIENLTDAIESRGPDDQGVWIEENKAFGHRRLSIIDIETGHQPMFSKDGRYGIVFNGEIYNYKILKKELQDKGHHFYTESDTEVLLYSYIEWKEDCLDKLRGMFAFAIIDKNKKEFFLARDHMGIKPLVYYHAKDFFAFSSQISALRKLGNQKFSLDLSAVDEYLWLQYIPAPKTVFNEVKKLKPAHYMVVTFKGEIKEIKQYWDLSFKANNAKSENEWLEGLESVLKDSVKAHLVADVPFGAFLSGGVDSSLVVKYMSEILDAPIETFSIGFEEAAFNELSYAKMASDCFKTNHHQKILGLNSLDILPDLVNSYGEPFGDSSAVPTYHVSKLARKHVPMVLSGDGADEIFAGYNSHRAWLEYLDKGDQFPLWKKTLRPFCELTLPKRYPRRLKYGDGLLNWLSFINYMPTGLRSNLWKKEFQPLMVSNLESFESAFEEARKLTYLKKVQYMDIKTYLPYDILAKVDIASMMHGLEVRTPFVDKTVYEFAASIPDNINFQSIKSYGNHGKVLCKRILQKDMCQDYAFRNKMGFAMPLKEWFGKNSFFFGELNERLLSSSSMLLEYFEVSEIEKIIISQNTGQMWLLLFLEEWLKQESCNS